MDERIVQDRLEQAGYRTQGLERVEEGQMGAVFMHDSYVAKLRDTVSEETLAFRRTLGDASPAILAVLDDGERTVLVEERIHPSTELTTADAADLGRLLQRLHEAGRAFKTGDRLPSYEYRDGFAGWENLLERALPAWKETRAREAKQLREDLYATVEERVASIDFEEEPVFFQHRDVILENVLQSGDRMAVTDFEFAALGYRGIELFRLAANCLIRFDADAVVSLLDGYCSDETAAELANGFNCCLNYFFFNTFPFYLEKHKETTRELAKQRDQYLTTLVENADVFEDAIHQVSG